MRPSLLLPLAVALVFLSCAPTADATIAFPPNGIRGTVSGPGNGLLAGAEVSLIHPEFLSTTTGQDGQFTIYGHDGSQVVQAWAPGFAPVRATVEVPGDTFAWNNFTLPAIGPTALVGRVIDGAGAPVPGARLLPVAPRGSAVAAFDGTYRFDAWAGRWELVVVAPGFGLTPVEVELLAGEVRALDIVLRPLQAELRLHVVDDATGKSLFGASVHITVGSPCKAYPVLVRCDGRYQGHLTDADGQLTRGLDGELVALEVCRRDYHTNLTEHHFVAPTDIEVRLAPADSGTWCEPPSDGRAPRVTRQHAPAVPPQPTPWPSPAVATPPSPEPGSGTFVVASDEPAAAPTPAQVAGTEAPTVGPQGQDPMTQTHRPVPSPALLLALAAPTAAALLSARNR